MCPAIAPSWLRESVGQGQLLGHLSSKGQFKTGWILWNILEPTYFKSISHMGIAFIKVLTEIGTFIYIELGVFSLKK